MSDDKPLVKQETQTLVNAFTDLSDGVVTLFRQHLDLFRAEAKRDARAISRDIAFVAVGAGVLAFGYTVFWLTVILGTVALAGSINGTWVAAVIATLHLVLGAMWVQRGIANMKSSQEHRFENAKSELERSSKWVKQITDSSSPSEKAPS